MKFGLKILFVLLLASITSCQEPGSQGEVIETSDLEEAVDKFEELTNGVESTVVEVTNAKLAKEMQNGVNEAKKEIHTMRIFLKQANGFAPITREDRRRLIADYRVRMRGMISRIWFFARRIKVVRHTQIRNAIRNIRVQRARGNRDRVPALIRRVWTLRARIRSVRNLKWAIRRRVQKTRATLRTMLARPIIP